MYCGFPHATVIIMFFIAVVVVAPEGAVAAEAENALQPAEGVFRFLAPGDQGLGPFDPGLLSRLRVVICELGPQGCGPNVVRVLSAESHGSDAIRLAGDSYQVIWKTRRGELNAARDYRLCVFVDQTDLGCADVDVRDRRNVAGRQPAAGEARPLIGDIIPRIELTIGVPLRIRFFVGLRFAQVSAGTDHTCAVTLFQDVYCWGNNGFGQLGDGTNTLRLQPTRVRPAAGFSDRFPAILVSAGGDHTCALAPDERVWCWGSNTRGQLGDGSRAGSRFPVRIADARAFIDVSTGFQHVCAVARDGLALCWGRNIEGQLGNGGSGLFADRNTPTVVGGIDRFIAVTAGSVHTCAATDALRVRCWGANDRGQLGDGTLIGRSLPVQALVPAIAPVDVEVSAGNAHTCAVTADLRPSGSVERAVWCWGANEFGQLGDGTNITNSVPVRVAGSLLFTAVDAGGFHTCALTEGSGSAHCWGGNSQNQLADGSLANQNTPVPVLTDLGFSAVSGGHAHTCALAATGRLWCWGGNDFGELGSGDTRGTLVPIEVISPHRPWLD